MQLKREERENQSKAKTKATPLKRLKVKNIKKIEVKQCKVEMEKQRKLKKVQNTIKRKIKVERNLKNQSDHEETTNIK